MRRLSQKRQLIAALEFYAREENYEDRIVPACGDGCCSVFEDSKVKQDGGAIARQLLIDIGEKP